MNKVMKQSGQLYIKHAYGQSQNCVLCEGFFFKGGVLDCFEF